MRERGAGRVVRGAGKLRAARVSKRLHRSHFPDGCYWCARSCRNGAAVGQAFSRHVWIRTAWKGCPTTLPPASSKNSKITKEILRFGSAQGAGAEPFLPASSKNSKITKEILRFGNAQGAGTEPFLPASSKNSKITKEILRFGNAQGGDQGTGDQGTETHPLLEKLNLSVVNGIEDAECEVERRKGLEAVRSNVGS